MLRLTSALGVLALLAACTNGHSFVVAADRQIASATLTLNGSAAPMIVSGSVARGSRNVADASGNITVSFSDGSSAVCSIGYITNGEMEPHVVQFGGGQCKTRI